MTRTPYWAAFTDGIRRTMAAPAELAVRISFFAVILIVFSSLWRAAIQATGGAIQGYGYRELMWYVIAAEGCVIATKPRLIEEIGDDIGNGAIAIDMLRPVSVVGFRMAAEMGEAVVRLACALSLGAAFGLLTVGGPPSLGNVLLALPAALLAVGCNLTMQYSFAAAAFWVEDAKSTWFLYQKLVFLMGGMLLPLELLPEWLAGIARLLPFWTTAYIPARLLSGHAEWQLLIVQLGWLAVLAAAALAAFRAGEKRLVVAGG